MSTHSIILGNGVVSVGICKCDVVSKTSSFEDKKCYAITFGDLAAPHEIGEKLPKTGTEDIHTGIVFLNAESLGVLKRAIIFIEEKMESDRLAGEV